jgi:hypothetical protein
MFACPATDDFFRSRIDHMIDLRLDGHACFSLLEESDDLLIGKSCGLHIRNSPEFAD